VERGARGCHDGRRATVEALLDLAGTAAHASERVAAPIACYLVGRAGVEVGAAHALADAVTPP
jgi:hypothetical protein